jgi:glycosyltransferase involved in cell wall biosynthesis
VIVPVWNPRPGWLREAVESALSQARSDVEVIVVDDGCPDPVGRLLDSLDDPRLRVLRIEHGGVARARNAGLAVARGRFVRFLDADDVLERGSTARLVSLASGRNDVISYGATVLCDPDLRPRRTVVCTLEGDVLDEALVGRFTVRLPAMLFPRQVVDAAGTFDPSFELSEDGDWLLRALVHAGVRGETETAVFYRRHGDSVTATASADVARGEAGLRLMIERHFARHPTLRGSRLHRRAHAWVDVVAAQAWAAQGDYLGAARRIASAFRHHPRAGVAAARAELPRIARRGLRRLSRAS